MALTQLGQAYQDSLKNNKSTPGNNTAQVASQTQVKTPGATTTGLASAFNYNPSQPVSKPTSVPTYNEQSTTNYGGKSNPLNEILNSKKQYDTGVANNNNGLKSWASNNAQQYYGQLSPDESAYVKSLDTQGLIDYINNKNAGNVNSGTDSSNPAGASTTPDTSALQQASQSQSPYQSSYAGPDIAGMTKQLQDIFSNRQASELQKLRDARDTALQGYNSQETTAKQGAYDSRNQADTINLQNEQRMKEQVANSGYNTDGQNLTLQAGQNAQRLGDIGQINRQENNALQDISQQRALLQNNEAKNELALTQQVNSDQASALYDLLKYGDTRAFDVDQSNYGRYRDDVNQQFAQDQFGWQKQTDLADLLGTINGQQTLAAQNQGFNQQLSLADLLGTYNGQSTLAGKNANLNAALQVGDQTGKVITPTQNWGNLFEQAGNSKTPLNLAGQQNQLNQTQTMAQLTGRLPNGQKTTDQQQRDLENQWALSEQTGTISDTLAKMYGIPKGTSTQAAKQFAMNYNRGVLESNRDYKRGVLESDRNYNQDQTKQDQPRTASPNEVGTLLQNLQLQGQDSGGKTYYYIPGKGKDSRNDWVSQTVQTLVDANYDNATIEQVLRKAGISQDEENTIFDSGK